MNLKSKKEMEMEVHPSFPCLPIFYIPIKDVCGEGGSTKQSILKIHKETHYFVYFFKVNVILKGRKCIVYVGN